MLMINLQDIKNKDYEIIGLVSGSVAYSKHVGKDFIAGFKNMVGGELTTYTEMIEDAKGAALNKLRTNGERLGADAILGIDYTITNMQQGSALVVNVIGTAVKYI